MLGRLRGGQHGTLQCPTLQTGTGQAAVSKSKNGRKKGHKGWGRSEAMEKIPKGWVHCRAFNEPIAGARMLSMKAPLDEAVYSNK